MELRSPHLARRATLVGFFLAAVASPALGQGSEANLYYHLAQEARRQGDDARANEWLAEAVRRDPEAPVLRVEWAAGLLAAGEIEAAEAALATLARWWEEGSPGEDALRARYARLRAATAARSGRVEDAVLWYERAVEHAPRDIGLRGQLAGHYRARGEEEKALLHLRAAAATLPDNGEVHVEVGRSLLVLGRWAEAESSFGRAVDLEPENEHAWDGLGVARTHRGNYAGAEEALRRALRAAPGSAVIYEHLGDALIGDGRAEAALTAYQRAAALAPGESRLIEKIARAQAALPW